jgi:hypothetical protein
MAEWMCTVLIYADRAVGRFDVHITDTECCIGLSYCSVRCSADAPLSYRGMTSGLAWTHGIVGRVGEWIGLTGTVDEQGDLSASTKGA